MNQSFYIGAVGAHQQMRRLNVHGNNIANVNTYGYKAQKSRFESLMYDEIKAIDDKMLSSGVGVCMSTTDTDFSIGGAADTGRRFDFMIAGEGFFALTNLQTGEVSLTRNGAFQKTELVRPTGEVDENGDPVLDENGQPLTESIWYLADGEGRFVLSSTGGMIEVGEESDALVDPRLIGVFDYINYNGMLHENQDTRFSAVEKNGNMRFGTGTVIQGMLELSNADLTEEMTKVIESQRAYTMALKMVQTSDEIETTIIKLRT